MEVIPAIDLMNGKIVRLSRGNPKTAKVYSDFGNPLEIAKKWKNEGAKKLHIIDLDTAFGLGDNIPTITEIARNLSVPIQVGGGIRTMKDVENLLRVGISQVILGALAFREPGVLREIAEKFGENIAVVALDNKEGKIMVEGWKTPTGLDVKEAIRKFVSLSVRAFLVTSIIRDGMLSGPDIKTLKEACKESDAIVIAAGGISNIDDLAILKSIGVEAVVIGKALYEGKFTLKEALEKVREE